ncbi:hypothetical protein Slin14017_G128300 [Septoria linicola]|nr:hypothetical protein Slin14017_G128300 [Septoria linicola]
MTKSVLPYASGRKWYACTSTDNNKNTLAFATTARPETTQRHHWFLWQAYRLEKFAIDLDCIEDPRILRKKIADNEEIQQYAFDTLWPVDADWKYNADERQDLIEHRLLKWIDGKSSATKWQAWRSSIAVYAQVELEYPDPRDITKDDHPCTAQQTVTPSATGRGSPAVEDYPPLASAQRQTSVKEQQKADRTGSARWPIGTPLPKPADRLHELRSLATQEAESSNEKGYSDHIVQQKKFNAELIERFNYLTITVEDHHERIGDTAALLHKLEGAVDEAKAHQAHHSQNIAQLNQDLAGFRDLDQTAHATARLHQLEAAMAEVSIHQANNSNRIAELSQRLAQVSDLDNAGLPADIADVIRPVEGRLNQHVTASTAHIDRLTVAVNEQRVDCNRLATQIAELGSTVGLLHRARTSRRRRPSSTGSSSASPTASPTSNVVYAEEKTGHQAVVNSALWRGFDL